MGPAGCPAHATSRTRSPGLRQRCPRPPSPRSWARTWRTVHAISADSWAPTWTATDSHACTASASTRSPTEGTQVPHPDGRPRHRQRGLDRRGPQRSRARTNSSTPARAHPAPSPGVSMDMARSSAKPPAPPYLRRSSASTRSTSSPGPAKRSRLSATASHRIWPAWACPASLPARRGARSGPIARRRREARPDRTGHHRQTASDQPETAPRLATQGRPPPALPKSNQSGGGTSQPLDRAALRSDLPAFVTLARRIRRNSTASSPPSTNDSPTPSSKASTPASDSSNAAPTATPTSTTSSP